jgi:hypothetical protein
MPKSGQKKELTQVISYTPPQLYTGKEWYIGWHSYDPVLQAMRRKKIKLNHIKKKIERRSYANDLRAFLKTSNFFPSIFLNSFYKE